MNLDRDIQNTPPFYALGIIAYSIEKSLQHTKVALECLNKLLEQYDVEARRKD